MIPKNAVFCKAFSHVYEILPASAFRTEPGVGRQGRTTAGALGRTTERLARLFPASTREETEQGKNLPVEEKRQQRGQKHKLPETWSHHTTLPRSGALERSKISTALTSKR